MELLGAAVVGSAITWLYMRRRVLQEEFRRESERKLLLAELDHSKRAAAFRKVQRGKLS